MAFVVNLSLELWWVLMKVDEIFCITILLNGFEDLWLKVNIQKNIWNAKHMQKKNGFKKGLASKNVSISGSILFLHQQ